MPNGEQGVVQYIKEWAQSVFTSTSDDPTQNCRKVLLKIENSQTDVMRPLIGRDVKKPVV